jgi:hypothetical protein
MSTLTRTIWQDVYTVQFDKDTGGRILSDHMDLTNEPIPNYAVTEIGIQGTGTKAGKFAMPLNDHPNYKAPSGNLETEQATGIATRRKSEYNIVQTGEAVQFNLPQNGDAYNTSLFAQLLFQYGFTNPANTAADGAGLNIYKCSRYTTAETKFFAHFVRHLQPQGNGADIDLLVRGGICHTLTVSAETGGVLTIEPTIYGAKWEQTNMSGVANTAASSFANITPLKFQDSSFAVLDIDHTNAATVTLSGVDADGATNGTITSAGSEFTTGFPDVDANGVVVVEGSLNNNGVFAITKTSTSILKRKDAPGASSYPDFVDEGATTEVKITPATWRTINTPSVSMTFTNNCQFTYYNDDEASSALTGRLTCEGTFSMPFGTANVGTNYMVQRFLNGQEFLLAWYWGQSDDAVDVMDDFKLTPVAPIDRLKNDTTETAPKNYASFVVCARITDYEMAGDNEQMIDVTFQGVTTDFHEAFEMYFGVDKEKSERVL